MSCENVRSRVRCLPVADHPTILIVDDQASARDTLEALLTPDGYGLAFASSGQEALTWLDRPPVELVLCDVMMPGIDGLSVCHAVKAHPVWRYVPIVLITALNESDDMVRGLEAGADEFLTKPVDKVTLRARVRAMLRVREHYVALQRGAADVDSLLHARKEALVRDAKLSTREREVLDLLLLGRSHQDIARALGISERTSKFHQTNILEKLGAESRVDLTRLFL